MLFDILSEKFYINIIRKKNFEYTIVISIGEKEENFMKPGMTRKYTVVLFITFLLLILPLFTIKPVIADPQAFTLKWTTTTGLTGYIGPVTKDINDDGIHEIFIAGQRVGTTTGRIICVNGSTGSIIWEMNFTSGTTDMHVPCAIADLNNDGMYEIVHAADGHTIARNCIDGSIFWDVPVPSGWHQIVIADVDSNNMPYVYVSDHGGGTQYVRKLYGSNGTIAAEAPHFYSCYGGVSAADLNGDGATEILVSDRSTGMGIKCYDADLNLLWYNNEVWCSSHCIMAADVTGDGFLEVIAGHQADTNGGIYVLDYQGNKIPGKCSKNIGLGVHCQPAIYDIDKDGHLEFITDNNVRTQVWDLVDWTLKWQGSYENRTNEPPDVANVGGDSDLELICPVPNLGYTNIYDSTFSLVDTINYAGYCTVVQDIDDDGKNEIIFLANNCMRVYDTLADAPEQPVRTDTPYYSERRLGAGVYVPPIGFPENSNRSPDIPSDFTARTRSRSRIDLTWNKGSNTTDTRIECSTVSDTWNRGEGVIVYNGTGTSCVHGTLTDGMTYHYRAWSYNSLFNIWNETGTYTSNTTGEVSFYVSSTGDDTNTGLSPDSPWQTITKLNTAMMDGTLVDGNNIYLLRGDTFSTQLSVGLNGSLDDPIAIDAYGTGDKPKFTGTPNGGAIYVENHHNITIQNIQSDNTIDRTWKMIHIVDSAYIKIQNIDTSNLQDSSEISITNSRHIIIRNCIFNSSYYPIDSIIVMYCKYVLIENNVFYNSSHNAVSLQGGTDGTGYTTEGAWAIIRNNTVYTPRRAFSTLRYQNNTLFENNRIYDDGNYVPGLYGGDQILNGFHSIFRFNIYKDFWEIKAIGEYNANSNPKPVNYNSIYHNTFYSTHTSMDRPLKYAIISTDIYSTGSGSDMYNCSIMNNIFYTLQERSNVTPSLSPRVLMLTSSSATSRYYDYLFNNNLLYVSNSQDNNIFRFAQTGNTSRDYNMSTINSLHAPYNDWITFEGNIWGNPQVNIEDFTLNSTSPAIDAGAWLTTTTQSKTSSTIHVERAQYFYPRLTILGEIQPGDYLFVGNEYNLEVLSVNDSNSTLLVNRTISYSYGDNVSLMGYQGSAPNIGACQQDIVEYNMSINYSFSTSDPLDTNPDYGWENITCTVNQNSNVEEVFISIMYPNNTISNVVMSNIDNTDSYFYNTTLTLYGNYSFFIYTVDIDDNIYSSEIFNYSLPANWDINNDGICNVFDLVLVSIQYGLKGASGWIREDVDNNGEIQVLDFILVSNNYGSQW